MKNKFTIELLALCVYLFVHVCFHVNSHIIPYVFQLLNGVCIHCMEIMPPYPFKLINGVCIHCTETI